MGKTASSEESSPPVGTAPVNWNNDDLTDWRPEVPFPEMIAAMAATGYAGTEYGNRFPTELVPLQTALNQHHLALCGCYQWLPLIDTQATDAVLQTLPPKLELLTAAGCEHLIIAQALTPERVRLAGHVPEDGSAGLDATGWNRLVESLKHVADVARQHGLRVHYHNHAGTYIETPAEVERLLPLLPPGVDLCFDTGHYAYGGGDSLEFVTRHGDLIGYLHLKDVDPAVLQQARANNLSFHDALRVYVFAEFGKGKLDVPLLIDRLRDTGYHGWIIVEQDTSAREVTDTARANRDYLRQHCGL